MTIMPEWLADFANSSLPDWISPLMYAWFPESMISFLILAIMLKCFLISFYCAMIYLVITLVKRLLGKRMRIRTRYYSWYALLFSIPLSGLSFSNAIKLPFYDIFLGSFNITFPELNTISDQELTAILNLTKMVGLLRPILFYLTVIWLLVTALKCLRQIVLNLKLRRQIKHQEVFADPDNLKQKAADAFGLRAGKIAVIAADFVRSPVSYGVFQKTILLPHDYAMRFTSSELYLLLLHEMGHIKNKDTVKIQLLSIAECFIWSLRPMRKGFIRDSEILCDNRVLAVQQDSRDTYGELLIQECSKKAPVKGLGFSDSFHTLKARVEGIYSHQPENHRIAAFAVAMVLFLGCYFFYASQVSADWLTIRPSETEIDDLCIYYRDKENDTESSASIFFLADSLSSSDETVEFNSEEAMRTPENQKISQMYHYENGQLKVDCYALYQYLLPHLKDGLQVTRVDIKICGTYGMNTVRDALLWNGASGSMNETFRIYEIDIDTLVQSTKSDRYLTFTCRPNMHERIYQFVAHWL